LNLIGLIHHDGKNLSDAFDSYNQAFSLYEESQDNQGIAESLINIGLVHQERMLYSEAIKNYQEGLRIYNSLGDKVKAAKILHTIGYISYKHRKYSDAMRYYEDALDNLDLSKPEEVVIGEFIKKALKKANRNFIVKQVLKYEFENQDRITSKIWDNEVNTFMVRKLDVDINETTHYRRFLNKKIKYDEMDIEELNFLGKEIIDQLGDRFDHQLSLYDLVVKLNMNLKKAKKLGQYLLDHKIINNFPRVPRNPINIDFIEVEDISIKPKLLEKDSRKTLIKNPLEERIHIDEIKKEFNLSFRKSVSNKIVLFT